VKQFPKPDQDEEYQSLNDILEKYIQKNQNRFYLKVPQNIL